MMRLELMNSQVYIDGIIILPHGFWLTCAGIRPLSRIWFLYWNDLARLSVRPKAPRDQRVDVLFIIIDTIEVKAYPGESELYVHRR
ncbi:hypothetical protein Ciccas_004631 [Cichlidogyrus casuarinus]|uniref:Uncharacterized protein n=1 Tax=Cichlidogyrus casuarinus TaxID=1844966 RepID=A0ABD2QB23_9PLAT